MLSAGQLVQGSWVVWGQKKGSVGCSQGGSLGGVVAVVAAACGGASRTCFWTKWEHTPSRVPDVDGLPINRDCVLSPIHLIRFSSDFWVVRKLSKIKPHSAKWPLDWAVPLQEEKVKTLFFWRGIPHWRDSFDRFRGAC